MKTISILYHIIKNYMIRNKSIFIVFITSYILLGLLIVFIYGAFFPYVSERRSKELLDCRYIVKTAGISRLRRGSADKPILCQSILFSVQNTMLY